MSIRYQMADLVARHRAIMKEIEENEPRIHALEERILLHVKKEIRPFEKWVRVLGGLHGGSRTSTWEPTIHLVPHMVRHPAPQRMDEIDVVFTRIEGSWYWTKDCWGWETYRHTILDLPAPYDGAALEAVASRLTEELGVAVLFENRRWKEPDLSRLRTQADLQAAFPDLSFVAGGRIARRRLSESMGWDIPDHWALLKARDGGVHVFYSTNGHGHGFDCHLSPGDDFARFVNMSYESGFEGGERARAALSGS